MNNAIFQIIYCSRNRLAGTPDEQRAQIETILSASRRNNAAAGVTGALFHNTLCFAQVLEGPFREVQRVFERLQLDGRHADLVVLRSGYVAERSFADWSMAHAEENRPESATLDPRVLASLRASNSGDILNFLQGIVVQQGQRPSPGFTTRTPMLEYAR